MKPYIFLLCMALGFGLYAQEKQDSTFKLPSKRYLRHRITMVFDENMKVLDSTTKVDSVYMTEDGKIKVRLSGGQKFTVGPFEMEEHKPEFHSIYSGLYFGSGTWITPQRKFNLTGKEKPLTVDAARSFAFSFNVFEFGFLPKKSQVNLISGLGLNFERYQFNNPFVSLDLQNGQMQTVVDSAQSFRRNSMSNTCLEVPMLLRFSTHPVKDYKKAVHFAVGLTGQWRIATRQRLEYENKGIDFILLFLS